MEKDPLKELFNNRQDFDLESPDEGHKMRFLRKLETIPTSTPNNVQNKKTIRVLMAVAASVMVMMGLFITLQSNNTSQDLASVSPELSQTQHFFTTVIRTELNKVKAQRTPENEVLISDALKQMTVLESNYERLKLDLKASGQDKRVIYAMIANFQSRIDLLENLLKTLETMDEYTHSNQDPLIL